MPDSSKITSFQLEQDRSRIKRSFALMVKVVGSVCNLNCSYCYYKDKRDLYDKPISVSSFKMDETILEKVIRDFILSQPQEKVEFVWHGGEPTLLGLDYFKNIVSLQKKYAREKIIINSLQTNGTLIDDAWADFLSDNHFLCGLSIDGPKKIHDQHRKTIQGEGSWKKAENAANLFRKHGTEFNIMAAINRSNATEPVSVYHSLKTLGSRFLQFTPVVERIADKGSGDVTMVSSRYDGKTFPMSENVDAQSWGNFLCEIFDEWIMNDVGSTFIDIFENTFCQYVQQPVSLCAMSKYCACNLVVEHNGDVFSCDHCVFPDYKLGNIMEDDLSDLAKCNQQLFFEEDKFYRLSTDCKSCTYLNICGGDCPKNRFSQTKDETSKSILCEGFKQFFQHSKACFEWMSDDFLHQRPPSNIMKILKNQRNIFKIVNQSYN